mmetsp:Transcript_9425/g.20698  ORF Transcript_9425/g.20698 Transcript_9425/m.20698 type:complete len:300 (-) Transcript_9425:833-1732(-)
MACFTAALPSWASAMVSLFSVFSVDLRSVAVFKSSLRFEICSFKPTIFTSLFALIASFFRISALTTPILAIMWSFVLVDLPISVSHHPFWVASSAASLSRRLMRDWMRPLIFLKGSARSSRANWESVWLLSVLPLDLSKATAFSVGVSARMKALCWPTCTKDSVSMADPSASSSASGGESSSESGASLFPSYTVLSGSSPSDRSSSRSCSRARSAEDSLSDTVPLIMLRACARAPSSLPRAPVRWSHCFALSSHLPVSSFRKVWSSWSKDWLSARAFMLSAMLCSRPASFSSALIRESF